jgi:AraC-like DNA-binding protein
LQGDWTEDSGYKAVKDYQGDLSKIDFVFGQNDRMAMGARKALSSLHASPSAKYCGIDGLPGKDGGIELVRDSFLNASYIYPTHGDQLIQLAVNILEGKPYKKENLLKSALVTRDNANVLLLESEETMRQTTYLDQLHEKADTYLQELDTQRTITFLAIGIIILLLITMVLFYLYHIGQMKLRRERVVNTLWNLKPEEVPQMAPETLANEEKADENEPAVVSVFITRFKEAVEARLDESELSIEDLAADMNLSRVQLYRKVKSFTGSTPVELLRTARLKRGYHLLMTTDKSVSEVAYQVGFTAPSYFTKCFKEEYGVLPGDVRN